MSVISALLTGVIVINGWKENKYKFLKIGLSHLFGLIGLFVSIKILDLKKKLAFSLVFLIIFFGLTAISGTVLSYYLKTDDTLKLNQNRKHELNI